MPLYKQPPLIPDQQQQPPPAEPPAPEPDNGSVTAGDAATPEPKPTQDALLPVPCVLWANGRWAVTPFGLESLTLAGDPPRLIEYAVEASRLLQLHPGMPGVSMWAGQLARKTWVDDPDALLRAIVQALRVHHPDQTTVDLAATAVEVRRVWVRSRPSPAAADADGLGAD